MICIAVCNYLIAWNYVKCQSTCRCVLYCHDFSSIVTRYQLISFISYSKQKLHMITCLSGYHFISPRIYDFKHRPFSLRCRAPWLYCTLCFGNCAGQFPVGATVHSQPVHSHNCVTDRRTDRQTDGRTDWSIHRAAWSQLKMLPDIIPECFCFQLASWKIIISNLMKTVPRPPTGPPRPGSCPSLLWLRFKSPKHWKSWLVTLQQCCRWDK